MEKGNFTLHQWSNGVYAVTGSKPGVMRFINIGEYQVLRFLNGLPCELHETPYIEYAQWSVTGRCNAKCRHCYQAAPTGRLPELSLRELTLIADQLASCGVPSVMLTGGEPLARSDFKELLYILADRHISVAKVQTNGFSLGEDILQTFEALEMKPLFQISYDGAHGAHSWLRGVPNANELTESTIQRAVSHGFPVKLTMCLHRRNLSTISDTVRLAAELGCNQISLCRVDALGAFNRSGDVELLSPDELLCSFLDYLPRFLSEQLPIELVLPGLLTVSGTHPKDYRMMIGQTVCDPSENKKLCACVDHSFYISAAGRLLPCVAVDESPIAYRFPSLLEKSLPDCLKDDEYRNFISVTVADVLQANPQCRECAFLTQCGGGCRANSAAMLNGSLMGIDPVRCRIFQENMAEHFRAILSRCDVSKSLASGQRGQAAQSDNMESRHEL